MQYVFDKREVLWEILNYIRGSCSINVCSDFNLVFEYIYNLIKHVSGLWEILKYIRGTCSINAVCNVCIYFK